MPRTTINIDAALLRQHGVRRLYTNDSDFRKFDFLEVRNPFA